VPAQCTPIPEPDAAGDGTITTNADVLPGCFWIKPLLSAIEKANNQLAGIQREKQSLAKVFRARVTGTIETIAVITDLPFEAAR
jgi:hypothetical protein